MYRVLMYSINRRKLCQFGGGILLIWIIQSLVPVLAQFTDTKTYWIYRKDEDRRNFVIRPQKAAQEGVHLKDNKRTLGFKLLLTQREYDVLLKDQDMFPVYVEWYRFNRAKPSIFAVKEISIEDLVVFEKDGQQYYRLASTLEGVLPGTWMVKLSDRRGFSLDFGVAGEYEIIVH